MLAHFLETLLVSLVNGARDRHERAKPGPSEQVPADGEVLVGHTRPDTLQIGRGIRPEAVCLSTEARRRHLYVLGATGTGKTNLLLRLIESDLAARRSLCVIDLRGDLVDRILLRLARTETADTIGKRLLLLDLRDQEHVVGFNPLLGAGETYSRAFHLLGVLRQQAESWGIQLEETLRNSLIALSDAGWSLLEIEPLLSNPAFRASVLAQVTDSYVRAFFARYGEMSEEKQVTWRLPVLNKVTPLLAIPQLRLMFGQRQSFAFGPLLDTEPGRIILVSLAIDRLHQAAYLVGGLFVSAFQTAIMARQSLPEKLRIPVHFYIDEFETMATSQFEAIVAEGRRFGLGLTLSHQNLSQLPASLRDVLLNNVHTQFYFQTGAGDAAILAREIADAQPRDDMRTLLLTQGVGEAFLVRRGEPGARLKVLHSPDPKVSQEAVQALRAASFAAYARPRQELEREMAAREQQMSAPPSVSLRAGRTKATKSGARKAGKAHEMEPADPDVAAPAVSARPPMPAEQNVTPTTNAAGAKPQSNKPSPATAPTPQIPKAETQQAQEPPAQDHQEPTRARPAYEIRHGKPAGQFTPRTPQPLHAPAEAGADAGNAG